MYFRFTIQFGKGTAAKADQTDGVLVSDLAKQIGGVLVSDIARRIAGVLVSDKAQVAGVLVSDKAQPGEPAPGVLVSD